MDFKIIKKLIGEHVTVLELGANDGTHTLEFLKAFKDIKIYCFEPDPRNVKQFKKNVNDERCEIYEVAISNKESTAKLLLSGGWPDDTIKPDNKEEWDASNTICKPLDAYLQELPWLTFDNTIEVKTTSLDVWAKEHNVHLIDFIWADVEGAERLLIEGGMNTLRKTRYFYTECHDINYFENQLTCKEMINILKGEFEVADVIPYNMLFKNIKLECK